MAENLGNDYTSTLDGGITDVAATLDVVSASGAPSPDFRIIVDSEIMLVTGVATNTFTVTRGVEGTAAAAHSNGVTVAHVITKGGLDQYLAEQQAYALKRASLRG